MKTIKIKGELEIKSSQNILCRTCGHALIGHIGEGARCYVRKCSCKRFEETTSKKTVSVDT